ncbi:MAG: hypothetical protein ABIF84_02215 [Patescibacteria group bacterium]
MDNQERPIPLTGGGPRFGSNQPGLKGKTKGWINKYGSSVILPIIALLILAGGIYLYAHQKNQESSLLGEENPAINQQQTTESSGESETAPVETAPSKIEKIIPQGRKQGGNIIEKAASGEGATHLARRALKNYLKDNPQELTNEQKIYVEDYLKDDVGSHPLEIDQEITFSQDLIKEAIDASLELTPEQLKNLEKYSVLVVW